MIQNATTLASNPPMRGSGLRITERTQQYHAWLLALSINGYPIAGVITTIGLPGSQTFSYIYRIIIILLSVFVFMQSILTNRNQAALPFSITLFFTLYTIRLYYDTFYDPIPGAGLAFIYFIATIIVPTFACAIGRQNYDYKKFANALFWVSAVGALGSLGIYLLGISVTSDQTDQTGRLGFDALNPITIGYVGFYTFAAAYSLWPDAQAKFRWVLAMGAILGIYTLIAAASRGPLIALILSIGFVAAVRRETGIVILMISAATILAFAAEDGQFNIITRLLLTGEDLSSQAHLFVAQTAIGQALESPFFGHAYVETITYSYPHNLLIESGLAMGIIGFLLMCWIMGKSLYTAWFLGVRRDRILPIAMITALVGANLSGSIWGSVNFWPLVVMGFMMIDSELKRQRDLAALQSRKVRMQTEARFQAAKAASSERR